MVEAMDTISVIDLLIEEYPNHHVIIGGDLNTEMKGESPFDKLWTELNSKNAFTFCNNVVSGPHYTYRHDSLNQTKFNDHLIVSVDLASQISNIRVLDEGDNNSDHLPLMMNVSIKTKDYQASEPISMATKSLHWNKMTDLHKEKYAENVERLLLEHQSQAPILICENVCHCSNNHCRVFIQNEYDAIVSALTQASKHLPKSTKGVEKDWWTDNLTKLRDQSLAIQSLWIAEGRPRHGPTHSERLRVRAAYKSELRRA